MPSPIFERLNGARTEADPKRSGPTRPTERAKEQAQPNGAQLNRTDFGALKSRIQRRIIAELAPEADLGGVPGRRAIEELFNDTLAEEGIPLPRLERTRLLEAIMAELLSFGPIEPLLRDESISEIMVNGPDQIWVERKGQLEETDIRFENDDHVRRIIDRIVAPLGRRCDEASPMVDARLPDGSRVNAIIPPISLIGPVITIRKFSREALTMQNLVQYGSITPDVADFLSLCVQGCLNVLVSGGTGSGKTTLLNVLSSFIPTNERIVTIEDAAELRLRQRHVISLEKRPANIEGTGEVPIRQLVVNALRMRPDRVVVGECRGSEALDMLQAMNTGHDGSMTTLHSNGPRDTLARLETMVMMSGIELPHRAIREQIASAVDLIIHQERLFDGSRKVTHVSEVQGMEGDVIILQDIFRFEQGAIVRGKVQGELRSTGVRPKFELKMARNGVKLPDALFGNGNGISQRLNESRVTSPLRGGH
ncbi:MAG: CpaF family protein [Chloroflexi bacterium]|nr:CpaF family protein [Chloroflexota bacterium]